MGTPDSMRVAIFDCFSGIAGDMTLAALTGAGASLEIVTDGLRRLGLPAFSLEPETVMRGGISARLIHVEIAEEHTYQPDEMRAKARAAGFPAWAEARMLAAIDALEQGEAEAHGTDHPHLHEAGGVDAMIDICGSMLALEALDIESCFCPVVTVGAGTIARTAHGKIPASPGPAAANILRRAGFPMRFVQAAHELVTPTGAAILAAVAQPRASTIVTEAYGVGAGTFDPEDRPNALRIFIGRRPADVGLRKISELAANIDDMTPVMLSAARDRLLEAGALDAWTEPIGMKKGRPAIKLCALVPVGEEQHFASIFIRETTTLGVRVSHFERFEASRRFEQFESSLGAAQVKVSEYQGHTRTTVEFEDVKRIAKEHGLPVLDVQQTIEAELRYLRSDSQYRDR